MSELKWLDGYAGQTVEELIAFEGEYRIDSLILAFEEAVQEKQVREGASNLSDAERIILAIEALEREVNNGGYGQFFSNSSREFAPIIVPSLRRIGCARTADITMEALNALHLSNLSVEAIDAAIDVDSSERNESLEKCDALYYETAEDIANKLFDFIKANKQKITF